MSRIKAAATQPSSKLAAAALLLALALLSSFSVNADSVSAHDVLVDSVDYPMPSADRPAVTPAAQSAFRSKHCWSA